jgi:tetratricopeptide (TPR) repeat protein
MAIHPITRALIATCIFAAASFAQTTPAQNPPAAPCPAPNQTPDQAAKPCPPPAAKRPSAAEQFPFPGQPAKPANPPANVPDSPAPDSPAPSTTPSDAATQHPFPTQPPPKLPGDDSSSSSSRSPDDAEPAAPGDDSATKGDPPEGTSVHRKLPKVKRVQTDDERVDEDLNVAKFYFRDENYQGAYLRAKDAINVQPDYSTPHFVLAQIAQKMKKKDEAIAEYQTYLKLDPQGEKAKEARKALAELQPSGSH